MGRVSCSPVWPGTNHMADLLLIPLPFLRAEITGLHHHAWHCHAYGKSGRKKFFLVQRRWHSVGKPSPCQPDNLDSVPGPCGWKESTSSQKLSSDCHTYTRRVANALSATVINKIERFKKVPLPSRLRELWCWSLSGCSHLHSWREPGAVQGRCGKSKGPGESGERGGRHRWEPGSWLRYLNPSWNRPFPFRLHFAFFLKFFRV